MKSPISPSINAVLDESTGKQLEYRHLLKTSAKDRWEDACSKEFARICNGRTKDDTPGSNTVEWIHRHQVPPDKRPTYLRVCANYRPQKADPYRVRCTIGGNLIQYNGPTAAPTASLPTIKILLNSVLSTPGAKFATLDIKDFYLQSDLPEPEYLMVPFSLFPPDIVKDYNLQDKVCNNMVYGKVVKAMYGLPQSGRIAHDDLVAHLALGGYFPTKFTPGLFTNRSNSIQFALIVDDFGIKFTNQLALQHLVHHLRRKYSVTQDDGTRFNGITLRWDYTNRECELSLPGYNQKALLRFQHPPPTCPQDSPYPWTPPKYGQRVQFAPVALPPNASKLSPAQLLRLQEIVGVFRFPAEAVDSTLLMPVSALSTDCNNVPHPELHRRTKHFLDYVASHPDATLKFRASDMILWAHTDASYLSEPKARSRAGGFFFLSSRPIFPITPEQPAPPLNGAIAAKCKIIDAVMSSAQEAETGAGYFNARELVPLRQTLLDLGHPQPATPLQFDNQSATQIINNTVNQKRSKAMDMRFYWLRDRAQQKQFHIHWKQGTHNYADYFTKHHSPSHHRKMRPVFLHK